MPNNYCQCVITCLDMDRSLNESTASVKLTEDTALAYFNQYLCLLTTINPDLAYSGITPRSSPERVAHGFIPSHLLYEGKVPGNIKVESSGTGSHWMEPRQAVDTCHGVGVEQALGSTRLPQARISRLVRLLGTDGTRFSVRPFVLSEAEHCVLCLSLCCQ